MSRIVKAFAVVDDRNAKSDSGQAELSIPEAKVIKGGVLDRYGFTFQNKNAVPPPDVLRDEINRLRVQVEEAKAELLAVEKEIETAEQEHEAALEEIESAREAAQEAVKVLDDAVYHERLEEIRILREELEADRVRAQEEAEAEAKAAFDKSRALGYREGYQSGLAEAQEAFLEENQSKLQELADTVTEMSVYGRELMQEKEKEFVELVMVVAEKVIAKEVKTDPSCIVDMLQDIVAKNYRESYINLSVSPDMLPVEAKASSEVIAKLEALNPNLSVYVEKDAENLLAVETPKGVVDLSVDVQLENLREALLAVEEE